MYQPLQPARPTLIDRAGYALAGVRDFLDARGTFAWLAAMVAAFVLVWPLGLAILGYLIWSKRMFGNCTTRRHRHHGQHGPVALTGSTGNAAFDAYRAETLKRLEEESAAFQAFLQKLREAKDKSEFDTFMEQRRAG